MPQHDFDFDVLRELAQSDPPAYFRERERLIAEFIEAHPNSREQLIELQARIDGLRAVAGTPEIALRGLFSLLEDHLQALADRVSALRKEADRLAASGGRRD